MDKFNKKAKKVGINLGSSLNLIVQFSQTIDKIGKKLDASGKAFMNNKKLDEVKLRIPSDLSITVYPQIETNARESVQLAINSINKMLLVEIPNAKSEVYSKISFQSPVKYDKVIENWNKVWEENPITAEHVRNVVAGLETFANLHDQMTKRFNAALKAMEEAEKGVQTNLGLVNTDLAKILKVDPKKPDADNVKTIVLALHTSFDKLFQQKSLLFANLQELKNVLSDYNNARIGFVEFAITMRESFTSQRTTSMAVTKIVNNFANTNGKH